MEVEKQEQGVFEKMNQAGTFETWRHLSSPSSTEMIQYSSKKLEDVDASVGKTTIKILLRLFCRIRSLHFNPINKIYYPCKSSYCKDIVSGFIISALL